MRARLALICAAVAAMVATAFLVPLAILVNDFARDRAFSAAQVEAATIEPVLAVSTNKDLVLANVDRMAAGRDVSVYLTKTKQMLVHRQRASAAAIESAVLQQQPVSAPAGGGSYVVLQPVGLGNQQFAVIEIFLPASLVDHGVVSSWIAMSGVAVCLIAASVFVGDRVGLRLTAPVRDLGAAADEMAAGDLSARSPVAGPPEVRSAAVVMNALAERLDQLLGPDFKPLPRPAADGSQSETIPPQAAAGAAPATVVEPAVAASAAEPAAPPSPAPPAPASPGPGSPGPRSPGPRSPAPGSPAPGPAGGKPAAGKPAAEEPPSEQPTALQPAVAPGGPGPGGPGPAPGGQDDQARHGDMPGPAGRAALPAPGSVAPSCDAAEVLAGRLAAWAARADSEGRRHSLAGASRPVWVPVSRSGLAAAADALLRNIFEHTAAGTRFVVALHAGDGGAVITFADAGPGIADPRRVLDAARGSSGLQVARQVAESTGGELRVDRAPLGGTRVQMWLVTD